MVESSSFEAMQNMALLRVKNNDMFVKGSSRLWALVSPMQYADLVFGKPTLMAP